MGMGYSAFRADVVPDKTVEKVVGHNLYGKFTKAMENLPNFFSYYYDMTEDDIRGDDVDEEGAAEFDLLRARDEIQDEFREKTGMSIALCYHDQENNGDRHDGVDGYFWMVEEGMWTVTEAYRKFKEKYVGNCRELDISAECYVELC